MADTASLASAVLAGEAEREAAEAERARLATAIDDDLLAGVGSEAMSLAQVVRTGGRSTITVLFALVLVDAVSGSAFAVLGPDIQRALGVSDLTLGVVGALAGLMLFVAAIPLGYLGDRVRRTTIVAVCSAVSAAFLVVTGAVHSLWQLVVAWSIVGLAKANEQPIHGSLLADAYPIQGRNRVFGIHRAAQSLGFVVGPAVAGGVSALVGGQAGWRWAFAIMAVPTILLALAAAVLPEPGRGRNEMDVVLGEQLTVSEDELPISVAAGFARLKKIRTFYALLASLGALGFGFVAAPIYTNLILKSQFGLDAAGRGLVGSLAAVGGVVGTVVAGTAGDRLFRRSPEHSLRVTGVLVAVFGVLLPLSVFMPNVALYTLLNALGAGCVFGAFVPVSAIVAAVTPYRLRSLGFATIGLYLTLIGGLGGALIVGSLANAFGERGALAIITPTASFVGAGLILWGSRFVHADMAAAAADLVEERDERLRTAAGAEVPAIQVRGLDYSYGQVQVLFDVGLDVREGEVLALLGTNGAGKSTLLRAISGLGLADRGVIRFRGRTITFAEPGTRVRMGIVQVPGGKSIFPTLTVRENLLAGAYSFIGDRRRVAAQIDKVVTLFPVLGERMDQAAGTLSGGEQQMLGIAQSLLLDPAVLLIDELSLGLAPLVVQQLLDVVATLKAAGITMVIVEQSVNVALAVADRAVFMEKGQVRFEGPAAELAERDDLVRAVFLGGEGG